MTCHELGVAPCARSAGAPAPPMFDLLAARAAGG